MQERSRGLSEAVFDVRDTLAQTADLVQDLSTEGQQLKRIIADLGAVSGEVYDILNKLTGLQNLTSLSVKHTYTSTKEALCVTRPLKRALLGCPNIRSLELDIDMPRQGCVCSSNTRSQGLTVLTKSRLCMALPGSMRALALLMEKGRLHSRSSSYTSIHSAILRAC